MKIYDIQSATSVESFGSLPPGCVVQSKSGDLWIVARNDEAGPRMAMNLRSGELQPFLRSDVGFRPRPDIVLTTECNLRNKPE